MLTQTTPSLPATWINQRPTNPTATTVAVKSANALTWSPPTGTLVSVNPPNQVAADAEPFLHVTQMPSTLNATEATYGPQGLIHVKGGQMQVWEQASDNALGQLMGRNAGRLTTAARLEGLGAALLEQVGSHGSSYRQSVVNVRAPNSAEKIQSKAASSLLEFQSTPTARVELSIQTQSGAQVRLAIVDQRESGLHGTGLSVEVIVEGELSEAERAALTSLASGFEKAVQGLAGDATQVDLAGLTQFDSKVIAKLELTTSIYGRDEHGLRYEKLGASFKADANTQEIQLRRPDGDVKMRTDLRQPALWGSGEQKAYAVRQYLQQIDQAAQRGHASADLVDMFKSTFVAMNAGYGSQELSDTARAALVAAPVDPRTDAEAWSEADKSWLTGLADFDAKLSATPRASNPRKTMELDSFVYAINQTTAVSGSSRDNRAITQTQTAELSAAYHQSLYSSKPPDLTDETASQNYTYHQIEDNSSSQVQLAYEKDKLVDATLTQSSSRSQRVQKYEFAKLIEDRVTPPELRLKQTDLRPLLQQLEEQQAARKITDEEKQKLFTTWHAMVFMA